MLYHVIWAQGVKFIELFAEYSEQKQLVSWNIYYSHSVEFV